MSAVAMHVHMALLQAKMEEKIGTVAPDLSRVEKAHVRLVDRYPPHRLTAAALDTVFQGEKQRLQGSAVQSSAGGRGEGLSLTL